MKIKNRYRKVKKRYPKLLLTITLVLSILLIPFNILALGASAGIALGAGEAAEVNGTGYAVFGDALAAWTEDSTLKLLSDVTTSSTVTVPTGTHILDLNGHTITRTGATGNDNSGLAITVNNGVDLTVTGPGKITGGKGYHGGGIHVEGNGSLILDNCEISGNTGHYGGGLHLVSGTITLKNGTVVKDNSASDGFGGSGIYAEGGGTLIIDGCTFTNNEIKNNNQYAVFLCGNANIKLSGVPVIYDNRYGSAQHNLYMFQADDQHSSVIIAGALTDGTKITVGQTCGTGVFTSGWKANMGSADPAKYFTSDDAAYVILTDENDIRTQFYVRLALSLLHGGSEEYCRESLSKAIGISREKALAAIDLLYCEEDYRERMKEIAATI